MARTPLLFRGKLLPELPMVAEWRRALSEASATFGRYSAAACEAVLLLGAGTELLLRAALVLANGLALHLSILLKLNAFLRLAAAGVLSRREAAGSDLRTAANGGSSALCGGGGAAAAAARGLRWARAAVRVLSALCGRPARALVRVQASGLAALVKLAAQAGCWYVLSVLTASGSGAGPPTGLVQALGFVSSLWTF